MRSRQNSVNLTPSRFSTGRSISAGLLLALMSAFPMTDSTFAETYTLTNRVKPTEAGINGLPSGKKLADLTSADTLNVTGGNAQLYFDSSTDLNCNIVISGNANGTEKTGKFRLQNSSTVVNLNGMVTLAGDTAIGSHAWQDNQGKLYFNNQITGTGALLIAPSATSSVYLNNTTANKNNYAGNTQIGNSGMYNNSGVTNYGGSVYLQADEQIPDALTAGVSSVGNLVLMSWEDTRLRSKLDLDGHTETVNGLVSADTWSVVTSSAAGGKLIVGANNATSEFKGMLQGSMALEKIGTGTLTLSGANTYTGGTTVSAGELVFAGSAIPVGTHTAAGGTLVLGTAGNTITASPVTSILANGGTVRVDGDLVMTGDYFVLNGSWTGNGTITLSNGNVHLGNGSDPSFNFTNGVIFDGGILMNNNNDAVFNADLTVVKAGSQVRAGWSKMMTMTGALKGSASLTVASDSGWVRFSGNASEYTGDLLVNGQMRVGVDGKDTSDASQFLGSGELQLNGGTIQNNNNHITIPNALNVLSESGLKAGWSKT